MTPSRTIGRAALVVAAGILLSRILGFARNVLVNGLFGLGTDNDLYQAAFTIPDWLFFMMAGGYLSITLVPILSRYVASGDTDEAQRTFSSVFVAVAGSMLILTLALLAAARPATELFFPRFSTDAGRLTSMMRIALGSQVFFVAGTLLMAVQYAHKRFLVPTLAPVVYNLGIIGGGLVGWALGDPTPEAFLWGGLVGAATGNFGIQWVATRRLGFRLFGSFNLRSPAIREYFALALPLMIGQSVVALDEQWPRWFGQLADPGTTSGLVAARQLNMLPIGVIAQAAGVAAYPFLAGLVSSGNLAEFRATVEKSVRSAFVVAGWAAAVVAVLAEPLVRLAYERGSFDSADTSFVGRVLTIYAVAIPLWAAHQVYTRAFYAQRRMWLPVLIGTGVTIATVPALLVFARMGGGPGIAAVSTGSMMLYTALVAVAWHREQTQRSTLGVLARTVVAAIVAAGGGWLATRGFSATSTTSTLLELIVGFTAMSVIYLAVARALRIEEAGAMLSRLRRGGQPTSVVQP